MYRSDRNSNPDYCRSVFTPVAPETSERVLQLKLKVNALMAELHREMSADRDPEVRRHLTCAMSAFEEGAMWAVKGMTSENWDKRSPQGSKQSA